MMHTCSALWGRQPAGEGSWRGLHKCSQWQARRGPAGFHWFRNPCVSLSLADCCWDEEAQPPAEIESRLGLLACASAARGPRAAAAAPPPPRAQSAPPQFSSCSVLGRAPATSAPVGNLPRLTCPGTLMHIFLVLRPRRSTSLATQARELCLCHFRRLHTSCVKMLGLRANCTPPPPLRPTQVEGCSGRPGPVGKNAGG